MAAKRKLDELSDGELADKFGDVKDRAEGADELMKALKVEFDRRQLDFAKGERFKVTKDVSTQNRIDTKALREDLGAAAKKYEKEQTRTVYLVRPVEAS